MRIGVEIKDHDSGETLVNWQVSSKSWRPSFGERIIVGGKMYRIIGSENDDLTIWVQLCE